MGDTREIWFINGGLLYMHEGFADINRRLDHIIQMQLDEHATRIKKLEAAVFAK